ncbi:MAG: MOSC domain-containing protein [Candidatus Acidiferrales bacterium]
MHVAEIWRYPVKSMAGERLKEAELGADGIPGDRIYQVRRADGRIVDARAHPRMLGLHPTFTATGELLIDGKPWDAPGVALAVEEAAAVDPGARLVRYEGAERFDVLPLLVATDGAIAALGYDGRRLRPNILLGGVDGLAEREWSGRALRVGEALIGILDLRSRCVMTTYDPDTQEHDPRVLQRIQREFAGRIALDCWVIRGGRIRVGDEAELAEPIERPSDEVWGRYASEATRAK